MTASHLTPPVGKAATVAQSIAAAIPTLRTARLILRVPQMSDWSVLAPIWTTDRAKHIGGPYSAEDAWLDFNQLVAGWLLRGHGALTVTDHTGTVLGLVLLGHENTDPEPELGWLLVAEAEGQGYATEAAEALRDWGFDLLGPAGFVSYIEDANTASVRVATRLGARKSGHHAMSEDVGVYRYGGAA